MSQSRSILIIVNPTAGRGQGRRMADELVARLRSRNLAVTVRETKRRGDAERIAQEACGAGFTHPLTAGTATVGGAHPTPVGGAHPTCIVACGGDGTVQEVANTLASMRVSLGDACPTMGLAPAGCCNDFARALGISTESGAIADVLADVALTPIPSPRGRGEPRAIDLGRVNDRYFCTVATVGVDAEICSYVDTMRLPGRGTIAYLYGALCVLSRYRSRVLRIAGEFGVIERPLFLASSANTCLYGGFIPIAPDAVPTDGQLDLCIIDRVSRLRALTLIPSVLAGRHRAQPEVHFIQTRRFTIDACESLELWADGERIGRTPATIEVAPRALKVMLPDKNLHPRGAV